MCVCTYKKGRKKIITKIYEKETRDAWRTGTKHTMPPPTPAIRFPSVKAASSAKSNVL